MAKRADDQGFFSSHPIGPGAGGNLGENLGKVVDTLQDHDLGEGKPPLLVEDNQNGYMEKPKLGQTVPVEFGEVLLHLKYPH